MWGKAMNAITIIEIAVIGVMLFVAFGARPKKS